MPAVYKSPIRKLENITDTIYLLSFYCPDIANEAQPGQFVNIRATENVVPLWRRPFSIFDCDRKNGIVSMLIALRGQGTSILHSKKVGDSLNILGLLGNSFKIPDQNTHAILVAGGIGIAPLYFLAKELQLKNIHTTIFYGAQTAHELCYIDELQQLCSDLHLATDDGSRGTKGFVTDVLKNEIVKKSNDKKYFIYTCGPTPMLQKVARLCDEHNLEGEVSLETIMACGFGACMGCAVTMRDSQENAEHFCLTCKDGPVFNISEVSIAS